MFCLLCSDEPIPDWPRQLQQPTVGIKQAAKGKLPAKATPADEDPDDDIKVEDVIDTDIQVGHANSHQTHHCQLARC